MANSTFDKNNQSGSGQHNDSTPTTDQERREREQGDKNKMGQDKMGQDKMGQDKMGQDKGIIGSKDKGQTGQSQSQTGEAGRGREEIVGQNKTNPTGQGR